MGEGSERKDHLKFWLVLERPGKAAGSLEKECKELKIARVFEITEAELEPCIGGSRGARGRQAHMSS